MARPASTRTATLSFDMHADKAEQATQISRRLIRFALQEGHSNLSEPEAKELVAAFGVPIPEGRRCTAPEAAVIASRELGFPVVLKASGVAIQHKTDIGGVALNVDSTADAEEAARRFLELDGCNEVLVEEMVPGVREVVCGFVRKPLFGPCVVMGIGGVLTEVLGDAAFRIAPLTGRDALEMAEESHAARLLGEFRGEAPASMSELVEIALGLSTIAMQCPEVSEIDLNPIKIRPDGHPVAVDALVSVSSVGPHLGHDRRRQVPIDPLFAPESVVVVGASGTPRKPGYEAVRNILANGYRGRLYLVNPKGGEILGHPVHPSIHSLPETPDLAIIILPSDRCPKAVRECAAKGVEVAVISAGGFAEYDSRGAGLQDQLVDIAHRTGMRLLGPNTSGHISTPYHFTSSFFPLGKIRRGSVSIIAQTGNFATHSMKRILTGEHFGVARVIGLGNSIDIDECDALEYLARDAETQSILAYIESFRRPRQFLQLANQATHDKPIVLLKGGATPVGTSAASAHTAALATEDRVVDGLLRQAGIVRLQEYSDLFLAARGLSMLPLPKGNRLAILAPSGAMLVSLADYAARWGLELPRLAPQTIARLEAITPPYIRMRNPVDIWAAASTSGVEAAYGEALDAVLSDHEIDAVVPVLMLTQETGIPPYQFLVDLARRHHDKAILVTFSGDEEEFRHCRDFLEPRGIPTFLDLEMPIRALAILARCRRSMSRSRSRTHR